ncbi:MAG: M28 family peptidase [Spirochaetes bacterium]|nr:M28 family peptidase [Spirochaetota bacterium]
MDFTHEATECLQYVREIIQKYGPRYAGSEACRNSAVEIQGRLAPFCDRTSIEPFSFHSGAFMGFMRVLAVGYAGFSLCAVLGGHWLVPAMVMYAVCMVSGWGEFVLYREIFDPLYKKATGYNVMGEIDPGAEVRRQIIIAGHHDSARVFNFLVRFQKWYSVRIIFGLLYSGITGLLVFIWGIAFLAGQPDPWYAGYLRYAVLFNFIIAIQFYFFMGRDAVPGAGDNLIATAIAWRLATIFGTAKKSGSPLLQSTRLVFLSTDAEEHGLRGSRAYVKAHRRELLGTPTCVLTIDSLYSLRELKCLTSEINGFVKTSDSLARECWGIAEELGYHLGVVPMTFGGGATDAAEFARIGVEATCILGLSTNLFREGLVYHTMNDTVEAIEPAIVEAVLGIIYEFILRKDSAE